jgi:hypothetical protein
MCSDNTYLGRSPTFHQVQQPIATGFEDYILIGDQAFPIGDEFLDASGIPLGPVTQDYFGWYGYATIEGHPDLRLI